MDPTASLELVDPMVDEARGFSGLRRRVIGSAEPTPPKSIHGPVFLEGSSLLAFVKVGLLDEPSYGQDLLVDNLGLEEDRLSNASDRPPPTLGLVPVLQEAVKYENVPFFFLLFCCFWSGLSLRGVY